MTSSAVFVITGHDVVVILEGREGMCIMAHSTHFMYNDISDHSDNETGSPVHPHIGLVFLKATRDLLNTPSQRQYSYTIYGMLAGRSNR